MGNDDLNQTVPPHLGEFSSVGDKRLNVVSRRE
jgi:hypothetical protein